MTKQRYYLIGFFILVIALAAGGTYWYTQQRTTQKTTTGKINIVASVDFYAETAKAVGGDHVAVTAIINQTSTEPHEYEPVPEDGKRVAKADVVMYNGIGYDDWLPKLAKGHPAATISAAELAHKQAGDNPHLWYRTQTMIDMANQLAKTLSAKDPAHRSEYEANAQKYIASLKPLQDKVAELAKHADGQTVAVSEPVFDYALADMGYTVSNPRFAKAIQDETDPAPSDLQTVEDAIKNHKVAFFVNNSQEEAKTVTHLKALAKDAKVPVLSVTETMPAGKNYTEWMLSQYDALAKIQAASGSPA